MEPLWNTNTNMAGDLEESCAFLVDGEEAENGRLEQKCKRVKTPVVVSILCLLLVAGAAWWEFSPHASSPSSHSSRNGFVQLADDAEKDEEPKDDDETPSTTPAPPPPPVIPNGKKFTLTGVTGEIASLFAPESATKGMHGQMKPSVPMAQATRYLEQRSLLSADADPGQCKSVDQSQNATADNACYTFYSDSITMQLGKSNDIWDLPNLELKVTIFYEKLLDNDLIAHVRGLQGISATQRAQYCEQLRANKVFQARQLPSISNMGALLEKAGIDHGTPAYGSVQSMTDEQAAIQAEPTGHAQLLDSFKKQNEFNEAAERSQAEIEKHIAAAEGARAASAKAVDAKVQAAKAEAKEAIAEVKAAAAKNLAAVTAKLEGLELGKADLKSEADELQKLAGIKNDGKLGKGKKLTTMQLVQANGVFAGRFFHQGSASQSPRGIVVEWTSEALGAYGPQKPATPATTVAPPPRNGSLLNIFKFPAKPKPVAPLPDKLYAKIVKFPSESTSEYMFQSTTSSDVRSATRMYDTYGSSASEYTEEENNIGVSVGIPGVMSASAAYANKKSSSTATNKQGNSQKDESYKVTTSEFYQTKYYLEPRSVLDIPQDLVQSSASFLSRVRALKAKPDLSDKQVANMVFDEFGTHVCLRVTLGGSWRLSSKASSKEQETVAAMSKATSEASSKITAQSSQVGGKAGGTFMMSSVPVTVGVSQARGQASSDAQENTNAHGEATQESSANKSIEVTTQQTWNGGLSGGSASAWRLSLGEDQNSNWRIIGKRFEDCTPVWMYFPEEQKDFLKYACTHWFTLEINDADITKQAKLNLLGLVEDKCTIEPESTHLGVIREAVEAALTEAERLRERSILASSKIEEQKQIIAKLTDSYQIHKVTMTLSSDVSRRRKNFNWGSALSEFQDQCDKLNYDFGFPTGSKTKNGWEGWCLKGSSFKKIDINSHDATDSNWNYLRNAARLECQNRHFDGGFPDGHQKYGIRGVVCFKGLTDTVFTELNSPTVPQHRGWSGIAAQADKYCADQSGKNGYPHFAAGIPGRADNDGHDAKLICLVSQDDLIEEAKQRLVRYEKAAESIGGKVCAADAKDKKCDFKHEAADGIYCKTWKSVKPGKGNDHVDFEWLREKWTGKSDYLMSMVGKATVRLVGGTPNNGKLEVYHDGAWGLVCDDGWDYKSSKNAEVVCRQLGMSGVRSRYKMRLESRNSEYLIDDVRCTGSESSLRSCKFRGWGKEDCQGKEAIGVECEDPASSNAVKANPLNCDFEKNLCSWTHTSSGKTAWSRHKGATDSDSTGPSSAHGGSRYLHVDATGKYLKEFSIQHSVSKAGTLSFWYHMYGYDMGKLSVLEGSGAGNVLWSIAGQQQTSSSAAWREARLWVPEGSSLLRIVGTTGKGYKSDIAIDDITFNEDSKVYRAKLEACDVNICKGSSLHFKYKLQSDNLGSLEVWVGKTKLWEDRGKFGQKGDEWHSADVELFGQGCISIVGVQAAAIGDVAIRF